MSYVPPPQPPAGPDRPLAPLPPPGGYASPFPPPPLLPPLPPRRGGASAAFKWGAIFGAVAGVVNLVQVLVSAAVVNGNLSAADSYGNLFLAYEQCLNGGGSSANCQTPPASNGVVAIAGAFYGSCFVLFLLTLVIYLFAARFASKETARRGPGVWAAVIAAVVGSILYAICGVIAAAITGRSALLLGMGAQSLQISSGSWGWALTQATIIIDGIAMLVTAGIAALMGLGGAALGMRGLPPPGYPGYMMPPPGVPPFAPPPYGAPPMYAPFPPPGAMPGAGPPSARPDAAPAPDYTLPAQYPPLPSQYETPTAGGTPGAGTTGTSGATDTSTTGITDTTGNPGNA